MAATPDNTTFVGGARTYHPPVINKPAIPVKKSMTAKPHGATPITSSVATPTTISSVGTAHDGGRHQVPSSSSSGGGRRVATEHRERPKVARSRSSTNAADVAPPIAPPIVTPTSSQQQQHELLLQLKERATSNDYYDLLGIPSTATVEELGRARRELTSKLHPDHFNNDPEQKIRYVL